MFTQVDGPCKPVSAEEDILHFDDGFENKFVSIEYTQTDITIEEEKLPFSCEARFDIGHRTSIIMPVSRSASKLWLKLCEEVLLF